MEELKVQNSLLLQLINSKNRQNQILFQQYDQLAADNRQLQAQTDQLRTLNNQLKKQIPPTHPHQSYHQSPLRPSPFDMELQELKKKNGDLMGMVNQLKAQLEERGGSIILLQDELRRAKLEGKQTAEEQTRELKAMLQLKEQAVAELTEYMQVQAEKINQLTRQGILAIDNYEAKLTEKDTQCQILSEQIAQLNQKISQLQVVQVKEDASRLEGQKVKELQTIILSKQQSIVELSEFLQMQSDKVNKLQAELSQSHLKNLQDEMENLKQILRNKDQSIAELSDFLNFLSLKNKEYEQKLPQAQQQNSAKPQTDNDAVTNLQKKVQQLLQQIAAQNEQLVQLNNKPSEDENLVRESEMLRARLSTREDEVTLLSRKVEEMEAEISNLRLQLDDKIVKITMLESISEQNDAEFPTDKQQRGNGELQLQVAVEKQEAKEAPDFESILQLKQTQIQTLKATVEQKDQSLKDFTDFISQQTDKIATLQHNAEELEAIKKSKEQSIKQLHTFLEESYSKNAQLADGSRQLQENISRLQEQINNLKKKETYKESLQAQERIDIVLPPSHSELGSPLLEPSSSLHERIKQLQGELASKIQTIAELSDFMNSQAQSLRVYKQKQEQQPSDRIAELQAIIKLKEQSNNELSAFLEHAYAKTAEMDLSLNESQRNMLNAQEELFVLKTREVGQGNQEESNLAKKMRDTIQELKIIIAEKQYNIQELQKSNRGTSQKQETLPPSQMQHQLREQIQSLENMLAQKDGKIEELSDFMNQQAEELDNLTNKLETMDGSPQCAFQPASEQDLRRQIDELSQTLKSKDENIMELTEFMTQQAEELEVLRSSLPQEGKPSDRQQLMQKIEKLQQIIIKAKQTSQSETNLFLQEAYSKIAALEQQKKLYASRQAEITEKMNQQLNATRQLAQSNKLALADRAQAEEALSLLTQKYAEKEEALRQLKQQPTQRTEQDGNADQAENIKALKATIEQLEDILNVKSQTIAELSQFMNEQSMRVEELEAQLNAPEGSSNSGNKQKIEELQAIIKFKEASISELTSFLEEAYAKNAELQALASVKPLQQSKQNQEEESKKIQAQPSAKGLKYQHIDQRQIDLSDKESQLARLKDEIEVKNAEISKLNTLLQDKSKQLNKQEQRLRIIKSQAQEAQNSYSHQLEEYNQHRQSMEAELGNLAQALQEQVALIELRESDLGRLEQQTDKINSEIKKLEDAKKGLNIQGETKKGQVAPAENASTNVAELQAKITEYEGFLNDREEEMAAMMEVMENLQVQISNKNELINQLQESNTQLLPEASNNAKIQQLQAEINSLRQTINDLQGGLSTQQKQIKVLGGYDRLQMQDALREQSNKLKQQYQQELNNMRNEEIDLQRQLNLNGDYSNALQQVDNNEQLTVLQVVEQILVYSEEDSDLENILRLVEVLKRSYLRENECILKENNQLKDTLNNLLEINNSLVEQIEKMKAELDQQRSLAEQQQQRANEAEERAGKQEISYQQEIKQLRRSITGLRDESPIGGKAREQDLHTISRLQDEVVALRQENQQREVQIVQLKANSNKRFVNQLNNLLDSCTVAKQGEEMRELEQELQRVVAERDQLIAKCKDYEGQVLALQRQSAEQAATIENAIKKQPQTSQIQVVQGQDSLQTAELLAGLEQPARESQRQQSELEESSLEKLRSQNQQLNILLQQKSAAISELQETMLGLQKGYNSEIMSLRKNIAELKNEAIALRKSLYQANPDGVDIQELIKDTFDHAQRDTDFFRPNYPTYTHSLLLAHHNNNSYYSDAQQRPLSQYQRFFPPNTQLNLGEKFMGRRCRQASPFSYGGEASRATAWQAEYPRY